MRRTTVFGRKDVRRSIAIARTVALEPGAKEPNILVKYLSGTVCLHVTGSMGDILAVYLSYLPPRNWYSGSKSRKKGRQSPVVSLHHSESSADNGGLATDDRLKKGRQSWIVSLQHSESSADD